MRSSYYKILGIDENATLTDIKQAYRKNAKLLHPDVSKDPNSHDQFILLNEAYEYLQNLKTGKVYNSKRSEYTKSKTKQRSYEKWREVERSKARARARKHAEMKYETFTKTAFYETSIAVTVVLEFVVFLFALFIMIGVPIIAYFQTKAGLLWGGIVILVTSPFWINKVILDRPNIELKELTSSLYRIFKTKVFQIVFVTMLNLYLLLYFGFNTFIIVWYLPIVFIAALVLGYIASLKVNKKTTKFLIILGGTPGILSLFFMINFFFSSNEMVETYSFEHMIEITEYGEQKSSQIRLEGNKYEKYSGIRMFIDYESMKNASSITYRIEDGLFGLRVLKSYQFK